MFSLVRTAANRAAGVALMQQQQRVMSSIPVNHVARIARFHVK